MDEGQVATTSAFLFRAQTEKPARGFFPIQVMSVEDGSDGEVRIVEQYLEHGANVSPSARLPVEETIIDIDSPRFHMAPSSPYVGEGCNNSSLNVDGVDPRLMGHPRGAPGADRGGGGSVGGGGGSGGGGSDGDIIGRYKKSGDGLSLKNLHAPLKKLAKVSIVISAQTSTALLFVANGTPKPMNYSIIAINVCSYLFCLFSFLVSESKPVVGAIISAAGSLFAAAGFLLTMCSIIPPEFIWVLVIPAIVLFSSLSVLSFG